VGKVWPVQRAENCAVLFVEDFIAPLVLHDLLQEIFNFYMLNVKRKRQSNSITDLDRSLGFQEAEAPRFQDNRHRNVVRFSALPPGTFTPQEIFLVLISVRG